MKAESTIRKQLAKVRAEQERATHPDDREALYGAAQALAWALGQDAMPPYSAFSSDRRPGEHSDDSKGA